MKKVYEAPRMEGQEFAANEFIAACGQLGNGDWVWFDRAAIRVEDAYHRSAYVFPGDGTQSFEIDPTSKHTIYMGSFYRFLEDGSKELIPDDTRWGHEEFEDYGKMKCVDITSGQPWGYHYEFKAESNHS